MINYLAHLEAGAEVSFHRVALASYQPSGITYGVEILVYYPDGTTYYDVYSRLGIKEKIEHLEQELSLLKQFKQDATHFIRSGKQEQAIIKT